MSKEETSPKGILKDKPKSGGAKKFHWDEDNIAETYHPANKTYGHMKIDEAPTPFEPTSASDNEQGPLDPDVLASRLVKSMNDPNSPENIASEEDEKHKAFLVHRKQHYNEFEMVKKAALEVDDEEDISAADAISEEAKRNANYNAKLSKEDIEMC